MVREPGRDGEVSLAGEAILQQRLRYKKKNKFFARFAVSGFRKEGEVLL